MCSYVAKKLFRETKSDYRMFVLLKVWWIMTYQWNTEQKQMTAVSSEK